MHIDLASIALLLVGLAVAPSIAAQDRLKIQRIAGDDNVVVMLDGRFKPGVGGCANDKVSLSDGDTELPNLRPSADCRSELAIFSEGNAMLFESPVTTWTNASGDVHVARLEPLIEVPVRVWIARSGAAASVAEHRARTQEIFRKNKVGVRFRFTVDDVSGNPRAVDVIHGAVVAPGGRPECTNIDALQESAFYAAKTLNVYYVDLAFTGRNCALKQTPADCPSAASHPKADGNINFIGTTANRATLAHEFGHAFGLRPGPCGGHTNGRAGFKRNNVMWAEGDENRDHFSLGQVFRMNTQTDQWGGTMLIENGLRPGPGRACPLRSTSRDCPALRTNWPRP
jgi:hypothetical protein